MLVLASTFPSSVRFQSSSYEPRALAGSSLSCHCSHFSYEWVCLAHMYIYVYSDLEKIISSLNKVKIHGICAISKGGFWKVPILTNFGKNYGFRAHKSVNHYRSPLWLFSFWRGAQERRRWTHYRFLLSGAWAIAWTAHVHETVPATIYKCVYPICALA